MTTTSVYFVGCDYFEYSPEGDLLGENTDPTVQAFLSLDQACTFRQELLSQPEVQAAWVTTTDTDSVSDSELEYFELTLPR